MKKQDWLLIYLSLPSQSPLMDPIRIMKGLFLFKMELGDELKEFYDFVPYLYGPCSFEIYSDLSKLQLDNFVDEISLPFSRWSYYRLSERGREVSEKLKNAANADLVLKLMDIKRRVMSLPFLSLLREIYKKYPEYARISVINFKDHL